MNAHKTKKNYKVNQLVIKVQLQSVIEQTSDVLLMCECECDGREPTLTLKKQQSQLDGQFGVEWVAKRFDLWTQAHIHTFSKPQTFKSAAQ